MLKLQLREKANWKPIWDIDRFLDPTGQIATLSQRGMAIAQLNCMFTKQSLGRASFMGNLLLNEGINAMWNLIAGAGGTAFNNANSYIGVGDSSTAALAAQTALQASTNKLYKAMDSTYPTSGTSQQIVLRSTFGSSDANWVWNEITAANGNSDSAVNMNRLVQGMGTKVSGATWIATLTITLS